MTTDALATDEQRIQLQRATVEEHLRTENAHDWPAVYETFVQDSRAHFDVVPLVTRFEGLAGIRDFYGVIETAFPDLQIACTGEYDFPGTSICELTLSGTQTGEYLGIAPTGNRICVEVAILYIFGEGIDAGKLIAERVYFDNEVLLRQCRGELEATGLGLAAGA